MSRIELDLLRVAYMLKPVRCAVLKSFRAPPIVEEPPRRGTEVELPLWLARELERMGIVEIREAPARLKDVPQQLLLQRGSRSLSQLPDFFYASASDEIAALMESARNGGDIATASIVEQRMQQLDDLARLRLAHILRAVQLQQVSAVERSLSIEEKVLAKELRELVESWLRYVRGGRSA